MTHAEFELILLEKKVEKPQFLRLKKKYCSWLRRFPLRAKVGVRCLTLPKQLVV